MLGVGVSPIVLTVERSFICSFCEVSGGVLVV